MDTPKPNRLSVLGQRPPTTVAGKASPGDTAGFVHSIETLGTVDGPGLRTVVFLAGCPLLCKYCHNVDVTKPGNGTLMTAAAVVEKLKRSQPYFLKSGGGVTFSGGDPLFQAKFLESCLTLCQEAGIHTAIDTALFTDLKTLQPITPLVDLFLVSIKQLNTAEHKALTGVGNEKIRRNLDWLSTQNKPIWIRYVLIPGLTNTTAYLTELTKVIKASNAHLVEVLPYHKAGQDKWALIGKPYELSHVKEPTAKEIESVLNFFAAAGLKVLCNYNDA